MDNQTKYMFDTLKKLASEIPFYLKYAEKELLDNGNAADLYENLQKVGEKAASVSTIIDGVQYEKLAKDIDGLFAIHADGSHVESIKSGDKTIYNPNVMKK